MWILFRRADFRFTGIVRGVILSSAGNLQGRHKTRLSRRHEQQSPAEPLNAEIRSGAEDGAEIETDRGR